MYLFKLILLCLVVFEIYSFSLNLRPKVFKMDKLISCPDQKSPTEFLDVHLYQAEKGMYLLNGKIIIGEDLLPPLTMKVNVTKCKNNHCEPYDTMIVKSMCDRINDNNALWAPFVQNIRPDVKCPMKKGTYYLTNGTFDLGFVSRLPLEGYRWIAVSKIYHGDGPKSKLMVCSVSETSVYVSRHG